MKELKELRGRPGAAGVRRRPERDSRLWGCLLFLVALGDVWGWAKRTTLPAWTTIVLLVGWLGVLLWWLMATS